MTLYAGDYVAARLHAEASLRQSRDLGYKAGIAGALTNLGLLSLFQSDPKSARPLLVEGLNLYRELESQHGMIECLDGLARAAAASGLIEQAALLFGAVEARREECGTAIPPSERDGYERSVDSVRSRIDAQVFGALWERGRNMTFEQAVTCALNEIGNVS